MTNEIKNSTENLVNLNTALSYILINAIKDSEKLHHTGWSFKGIVNSLCKLCKLKPLFKIDSKKTEEHIDNIIDNPDVKSKVESFKSSVEETRKQQKLEEKINSTVNQIKK